MYYQLKSECNYWNVGFYLYDSFAGVGDTSSEITFLSELSVDADGIVLFSTGPVLRIELASDNAYWHTGFKAIYRRQGNFHTQC